MQDSPALAQRLQIRRMSAEDWVEAHASGTLRKNKRVGMSWRSQYLEERTLFEFGWTFQLLPKSRITWGVPITEGDNPSVTEAGWHIERYIALRAFPEDRFEAAYLQVEPDNGKRVEGIGLVVRETSAAWLPGGHLAFALVAQYKKRKKTWLPAQNPS